ncbi:MAG: hypothetical protein H8E70_05455 [Candidatus Marinimicrobia bacterium]|nr:hypothetical protein [Candidatus Neomarinimicrobiota bacterium]
MKKIKSIIIVGIISIGLVAAVFANNDNKTAENNSVKSEKVSCTHQTSCSDQKKETCSYKASNKNCDKSSDKVSCKKAELKQACCSKKNG